MQDRQVYRSVPIDPGVSAETDACYYQLYLENLRSAGRLSEYRRIEHLGTGANADVWKVSTRNNDILVHKYFHEVERRWQHNINEIIRSLALPEHNGILRFNGWLRSVNTSVPVGLETEAADYSLEQMIAGLKQGTYTLTVGQFLYIASVLSSARRMIRQSRIGFHGDIKPANILIVDNATAEDDSERYNPKLADFSLGWATRTYRRHGLTPEQNDKLAVARSLYALLFLKEPVIDESGQIEQEEAECYLRKCQELKRLDPDQWIHHGMPDR